MDNKKLRVTQSILPKGGGAIQGIGEAFQTNEFTGAASISIPIFTSSCRGFEPHLSVEYNSGAGNGIFGLGFNLSMPNISRKISNGFPHYNASDIFLFSNAEDLVPANGCERNERISDVEFVVTAYRPRTECLFAKIEQWLNPQTNDIHWKVVSKDNITAFFGKNQDSRIFDPENPGRIFQWLLAEEFDAKGNHIIYEYKQENEENLPNAIYELNRLQTANKYINKIKYGNSQPIGMIQSDQVEWHFEVVFDYGQYNIGSANNKPYIPTNSWASRQDAFSTYHAGFEIRTHRLCRNILMFHRFRELGCDPVLVNAMHFQYDEKETITLLKEVESTGYCYRQDGTYETKSIPSLMFDYTAFEPKGHKFEIIAQNSGQILFGSDQLLHGMLVDLYGEGIPGIIYSDGKTMLYCESEGDGKYAFPRESCTLPIEANFQSISRQLIDLKGSGQLDLVICTPTHAGYYEIDSDRSWKNFRAFNSFPTDFGHPDSLMADVTGDGLADLILIEDDWILVYPSQKENGFGGPILCRKENGVPAQRRGAVNEVFSFADIFGTGKQHLVRISNGMVECWPNLGYGRFGRRVLLGNAPRFEPDLDGFRLFLVDLDGSGTLDLIYVYPDRVEIYFNQSGNSFCREPLTISLPGNWDLLNQIDFADIYGNGNACLVFSESHPQTRHRCYDFCQGEKPYLLNQIDNNQGTRSKISYCSSTRFYLQDKKNSIHWIGNLPFPVEVVQKIDIIDQISHTVRTQSYAYHHGCYDSREREFRGFGLVERQDAETLAFDDKTYDVPPILTKTWYHTGSWLQEGPVSKQYEKEYFSGDVLAHHLPDSVLDIDCIGANKEVRSDALRALTGMVLREEMFSLDKSQKENQYAPYAVTENNYRIRLVQPNGKNEHAVCFAHSHESITYDYERNSEDPSIHHEFILRVDDYGQILRSCFVAYGRRQLTGQELSEQLSLKLRCEDNTFISLEQIENGAYILDLPWESKEYEIINLPWSNGHYFSHEKISAFIEQGLHSSSQEESIGICSRLLKWHRYYYWGSDNTIAASIESKIKEQALLYRTDEAAFSKADIKEIFDKERSENSLNDLLEKEGRYRQEGDYWWKPGLVTSYYDASKFFLPKEIIDPFGNRIDNEYDAHCLMLEKITDPLKNQIAVKAIDYQALQPRQIRDINGNISEVLFDPLGMVVVSTHYGTENDKPVGFMQLKDYKMPSSISHDEIVANPQKYVQGSASFFYYDQFSWKERQVPVHTISLVAEQYHAAENIPIQIQITYRDGSNRELQSKTKVERGEAFFIENGNVKTKETDDRWLTSGGKVFNNKGYMVKQYEPYYYVGHDYVDNFFLNKFGISPTLFYDPLQRLIRIDMPKGFFCKSEFEAWGERHYDENDTVKDSEYYKANIDSQAFDLRERQALEKAALFYDTPDEMKLDNLGRTIHEIQNKEDKTRLITHYEWDIEGNLLSCSDSRFSSQNSQELEIKNFRMSYALNGELLRIISTDAGTRWQLNNAMDRPFYSRDSRGFTIITYYDALHRPTTIRVKNEDGAEPIDLIAERIVYGDSLDAEGKLILADPEKLNLRGEIFLLYDQAGEYRVDEYSIQGPPLLASRRLNQDYQQATNWNDVSTDNLCRLLQKEVYTTKCQYDALGRLSSMKNPDGSNYVPVYHLSGRLSQVLVDGYAYIKSIEYDPKGQRKSIIYGNNVKTIYEYESSTYRLKRISSNRLNDSKKLQDLTYTYDPVGNISHIADAAERPVLYSDLQIGPESDFTYDALYRLIKAEGREHSASSPKENARFGDFDESWFLILSDEKNEQPLRKYIHQIFYDNSGNLIQIRHLSDSNVEEWRQDFTISDRSNRAVEKEMTDRPDEVNSFFDPNGNLTQMVGLKAITWNYRNNIAAVTGIEHQDTPKDGEYYVYDRSGNRIRKVTEHYGIDGMIADVEETIYLGALEINRIIHGSNLEQERLSLKVMDDLSCVAVRLASTRSQADEASNPQVRYQLDNHLKSSLMEVDLEGHIISYEEYFPYGGTALIAGRNFAEAKLKKNRYSGKERSFATGLYYYGARYYAPWLGRWLSPDPAGMVDGLNLYEFVDGNPINYEDPMGFAKSKAGFIGRPKPHPSGMTTESLNAPRLKNMLAGKKYKKDMIRIHWKGFRDQLTRQTSGIAPSITKRDSKRWTPLQVARNRALSKSLKLDKNFSGIGHFKHAAEISHAVAGSNWGPNDELSAHPASVHQNTEWLAIEQGIKTLIAKGTAALGGELRIGVTQYVYPQGAALPGTLYASRYRIYMGGKRVFDHVALGDRGNIDEQEATALRTQVESLSSISPTVYLHGLPHKGIGGTAPTLSEVRKYRYSSDKSPMFTDMVESGVTYAGSPALKRAKTWYP